MKHTLLTANNLPDRPQPEERATTKRCAALLALTCGSIAIFCASWPAIGEEQRKIVLNDAQFKESYLEKVTVSGGIRAGFMHQSALEHIDLNALYIYNRPNAL